MQRIAGGGVTSPLGYSASATACGLKRSGDLDLALVVSDRDCSGAGVFTRNQVVAAPVILDRETLTRDSGHFRGVLVNSGVANACTGPAGLKAARAAQQLAAKAIDCEPHQVLVLSTGVIGVQLDLEKMVTGVGRCAAELSPEHGAAAARAIMTTDTRSKQMAVRVGLPGGEVILGGMAKGAGMIHPDMATMLAVLTTDAAVPPAALERLLRSAVDRSFNRITVDGDTSTNDTVLILANGASGIAAEDQASRGRFAEALEQICLALAQEIVRDGEGASRFVTLTVAHAPDEQAALRVAKTIATSPLVKTALAGGDPNWGRVLAAAGRAGVVLDPARLALWIGNDHAGELQLVQAGAPAEYQVSAALGILAKPDISLRLELGLGNASATVWTCDLTHDYVTINAEYHT